MVRLEFGNMKTEPMRALCDTGSQPNLITQNVIGKYAIETQWLSAGLSGISGQAMRIRRQITAKVYPWFDSDQFIEIEFWILPKESKWNISLPDRTIRPREVELNSDMTLADPLFWKNQKINLLLGIRAWTKFIKPEVIPLSNNLVRQETTLGSLIMGGTGGTPISINSSSFSVKEYDFNTLERMLKSFWELEKVRDASKKSKEQLLVEKIFTAKRTVSEDGKYAVPIIIRPNITDIGDSRAIALRRFLMLEKKFKREPEYHKAYLEFMREYEELGHMVKAENECKSMSYFIPHHGITSSSSFKVVFDCSCKTDKGISLNDVQLKGQKLQLDLQDILLRSRRFEYGISVDVKKMFRQIGIIPEHWNLQRIFWRENSDEPLREYCLVTVIYGQTSSPINAIMVLHEGAEKMRNKYPRAVDFIKKDFYMDDGFSGAESEAEAIQLARELEIIFSSMKLPLDKWKSNSIELMTALKGDATSKFFEENGNQSILGIKWDLRTDEFTYRVKDMKPVAKWTKRNVLATTLSIYDPVGHLAPVLQTAKGFTQTLWKETRSWDEEVSAEFKNEWLKFLSQIKEIENVRVPRWSGSSANTTFQLHGFADASARGFGAVIYVRTDDCKGNIAVRQIIAKSKVAPIKSVTIPRLELAAAHLLAKLMNHVRVMMEWENVPYHLYTDSMIVLQWLKREPCELKQFVANRIEEIQELTRKEKWSHVRSEDNPADLVSRGLTPREIVNNQLWWQGPHWLREPMAVWPVPKMIECNSPDLVNELKVHVVQKNSEVLSIGTIDGKIVPLLDYSNKLNKILLIYCYVWRYVKGFKKGNRKERRKGKTPKLILLPSDEEKAEVMKLLIKREQEKFYPKEAKGICKESKLEPLRPIRDDEGILRVGGRLKNAVCPYEMRVPIILPPSSRLTWLLINEAHEKLNHGHVQVMMQYLRTNYWIVKLRHELRTFVGRCVKCKRFEHPLGTQLMGDLPKKRATPCKPFTYTGIDYAGPIEIKEYLKTRTNKRKCWIAIFVCLNTRAIHIDIVTDLTSDAFIQCFKRFVGRRGHCEKLISDNATTFVGANRELKAALEKWNTDETHLYLNSFGTSWEFMTAGAPHQGGIYEAAVKSTKYHLRRVIGSKSCTYEQFMTLLIEIEAILNSRPIYALSDDPNDVQALTPGHFLVGEALRVPMQLDPPPRTKLSLMRLWKELQVMKEHFWKRWLNEYLPTLQVRGKWTKENRDYKVDQIVIIKDENLPPAQWLLGRITELVFDKENLVRTVRIKTQNGFLMRPVQKICILPVDRGQAGIENAEQIVENAE